MRAVERVPPEHRQRSGYGTRTKNISHSNRSKIHPQISQSLISSPPFTLPEVREKPLTTGIDLARHLPKSPDRSCLARPTRPIKCPKPTSSSTRPLELIATVMITNMVNLAGQAQMWTPTPKRLRQSPRRWTRTTTLREWCVSCAPDSTVHCARVIADGIQLQDELDEE